MALFGGAFGALSPLNYTKNQFPVKMFSAILASSTLSDFSFSSIGLEKCTAPSYQILF